MESDSGLGKHRFRSLRFLVHATKQFLQDPRRHLHYSLGRFYTVRRGYGKLVGLAQRHGILSGLTAGSNQIVRFGEGTEEIAKSLEAKSVFLPVTIPEAACQQILGDYMGSRLRHFGYRDEFYYTDIEDHRLPSGKPAILAEVIDAYKHPLVQDISRDERILAGLERYMGYRPMRVDPHILWSFAGPWGDRERHEAGQSIVYHFDAHSYNFVYAYFYLTEVDRATGAHVMVCGSHGKKPFSWLLGPATQPEEVLIARYGGDQVMTIEGPSGYGFIQDSSCFHKALAPISSDRLMLIVRYS